MPFDSLTFVVFFLAVLFLHRLPLGWSVKKINLLLASYVFYAAWNPPFVLLLAFSTGVDWFLARAIGQTSHPGRRKALVVASLLVNLGLLGFFKYGGFVLEGFQQGLAMLGIDFQPAAPSIVLPVGISFYTFQTLSYTLDVYRGNLKPSRSFLDYALFVSFFPQLVAGPIVRAKLFLPQCEEPRSANAGQLGWGFALIGLGLFAKVILADSFLAPVADTVFGASGTASLVTAWVGTLAFSSQIFFDFSGYSLCAIGAAMCLGFAIPDNFRSPYAAIGFSDFWRRWHISLSSWLGDYLYVSLGGSRGRLAVHTYANLMMTMLIGGLWHGASWLMVIWGGLHGLFLVVERPFRGWLEGADRRGMGIARAAAILFTFACVSVAWVFFRAESWAEAMGLLAAMSGLSEGSTNLTADQIARVTLITTALLSGHWLMRDTSLEATVQALPRWIRPVVLSVVMISLILSSGGDRAFIYFQF